MSESAYTVRRATVDDLSDLLALCETMHIPTAGMEKRVTEFQVATSAAGKLLGALGLQVEGRHGRIHSETFSDFALSDTLRPLLWERMQSLATNHGLARLWTQETAPFWSRGGFQPATEDALKKLPASWAGAQSGWLTMRLRDEEALQMSLDKEFARFKEEEQRRIHGTLRGVKALKFIATLLAVVLAIFVVVVSAYIFLHRTHIPRPGYGKRRMPITFCSAQAWRRREDGKSPR
jgi:N-acetylglutamate synthase-like GNAT family acetyltransferase